MPHLDGGSQRELGLKAGDWVEVRQAADILGTLDAQGQLDALPFMPEMLAFAGQRFRVSQRADKTCDTIGNYTSRRMANAVHLEGVRCGGGDHGNCQAGCLLFWKEAWLRSVDGANDAMASRPATANGTGPARERLVPLTRIATRDPGAEPVFVCQATELQRATTPLQWWDPRQYVRELVSRNVTGGRFVRTIALAWYNAVLRRLAIREHPAVPVAPQYPLPRWWDPRPYWWQLRVGRVPIGTFVRALRARWRGDRQPQTARNGSGLGLQPGDRVRVRSVEAIAATLGPNQRHKGLWFDVEMVPYCGGEYRVLRRVERIIDERTGKMMRMKNDCLILDGVACGGCLSRNRLFCPRGLYPFWREGWLERLD